MKENVTIITGASKGIGRAVAKTLAKKGHRLALISRNTDGDLEELANSLTRRYGVDTLPVPLDVTNTSQVYHAFDKIYMGFGKPNILITSAGMNIFKPFDELTESESKLIRDVNYNGALNCFEGFSRNAERGHIIGISSIAALASKIDNKSLFERLTGVGAKLREEYEGPWGHEIYAKAKYDMGEKLKQIGKENKDFDTTVVYPGIVGDTGFFYCTSGYIFPRKMMENAIKPKEVAYAVSQVIDKPKSELFVPWHYKLLRPFAVVAPGMARKKIWNESQPDGAFSFERHAKRDAS